VMVSEAKHRQGRNIDVSECNVNLTKPGDILCQNILQNSEIRNLSREQ